MASEKTNACWVGFDLGGTKMLATALDAQYRALGRKRRRTRGHEGAEAGIERITKTIDDALDDAKLSRKALRGIGIGCPGPLDLDEGIIFEAPNLSWYDVPISTKLQDEFGCPVVLCNDVDAGVYGEYVTGAAQDAHCVVGVFPGTGIGGGCVYEGRILRGKTGSCLEVGHIQVLPDGPRCGCGHIGCLEAVASRLAISAAAAQAAYRGQAPKLRELAGTDLSKIRSSVLAESVKAGDVAVEEVLRAAAEFIGTAVAALVNLLNPDTIVLGGGLVEAMPELFVETVGERARARCLPSYADDFRVVASALGDDATVTGAAAWARRCCEAATEAGAD
jgi:glucokinase